MRKILLSVSLILVLFMVSLVSANTCQDTDGGQNFYEKGSAYIFDSDQQYTTDKCESENQLREYYCKTSSTGVASRVHSCPEGCSDGVCLGNPIQLGEEECFDSDERINLYQKGHLIDKQHNADYYDTCLDEYTLREYYCGDENYLYYSFNCPNGCSDGACVELEQEQVSTACEVSDWNYPVGVNFYEKGTVKATGGLNAGTFEEYCEDEDTVVEYLCDVRGAILIKYDCLFGCEEGACKEESIEKCSDRDGGINYRVKGEIFVNGEYHNEDKCNPQTGELNEWYCDAGIQNVESYKCPNGCKDGVCLEESSNQCSDTDGGINYKIMGEIYVNGEYHNKDTCNSADGTLNEWYCDGDMQNVESYTCPNGCKEGACVGADDDGCYGCLLDGKCYLFGHRKDNKYCSDTNNEFVDQLSADSTCENNFECSTNLCIDGECVSSGLWQKFLSWLKKLFG